MQSMQTGSTLGRATMVAPKQMPMPQLSAEESNRIKRHTTFGAVKVVIGSRHLFETTVKEKRQVPGIVGKGGKPKEIEVKVKRRELREIRSLDQYGAELMAAGALRWISLDGEFEAETEAELIAMIRAVYGSEVQMRRDGKTVAYCAESTVECHVHVTKNSYEKETHSVISESSLASERMLLSDRSPVSVEETE